MKKIICTLVAICSISLMFGQTTTENYIKNTTYRTETTTGSVNDNQKIETVTYFDELGRPTQSVGVRAGADKLNNNLIDWKTNWTLGSGSAPFFPQNGATSENERINGTDPYGNQSMLWRCGNEPDNGSDGGWNTRYMAVDNTQTYRYSVWVKRTGSQDGRTYHGTQNVNNLNGSANGNPYFWNGDLPNLDQWYLLVGIVHPHTYSGGNSGISGVYDTNGTKIASITEFKWRSTTTTSRFRSYLYYATDTNVRQYFYDPILQRIDGNEASISELVEGHVGKDVVTHVDYDVFGRQDKDYLPYATSTNGGLHRTNALTATNSYYSSKYSEDINISAPNPFSQKEFENSPLNRVLKQAAPGEDWKLGEGNEIEYEYSTNTNIEVRLYEVSLTKDVDNNVITYIPTLVLDTSTSNNNGYYPANSLYKSIIKDENHDGSSTKNRTTEEFKDKKGRVVLKRTYADVDLNDDGDTNDTGETEVSHDTYYVYDKFGNLSYVLPPKVEAHIDKPFENGMLDGDNEMNELCYKYLYDEKNRLIGKRIPGKAWEYVVYNNLDQPIMTQDYYSWSAGNHGNGGWNFTKYDAFGRVAYSGQYSVYSMSLDYWYTTYQNSANSASVNYETKLSSSPSNLGGTTVYYTDNAYPNNLGNGYKVQTINYYDDYNFDIGSGTPETSGGITPITNPKGLPTGSKERVLGTNQWITTVTYYDDKSRPIYIYSYNEYLGTTDKIKNEYDFTGNILKTTTTHAKAGQSTVTIFDYFTYDHVGRLLTQKQKISSLAEETIALNQYDDLGQLISKGIGGNTTQGRLQNIDYTYNVRGWLKQINNPATLGNDLFAFKMGYNEGANPLYNGNISSTQWKTANTDNSLKTYNYQYDALNRITSAVDNLDRYSLSDVFYDRNGNIKRLKRKGHIVAQPVSTNSSHFGVMDDLRYTYQNNSNKLMKVEDVAPVDAFGYKDDAVNQAPDTANDYSYNNGGAIEIDETKTLVFWKYNHLGLLEEAVNYSNGGTIQYIYTATGVKLKKIVSTGTTTEYAGNYVYEDTGSGSSLKFYNHAEGYVDASGSAHEYVYQYKDHLGNVRLSYSDTDNDGVAETSEILEENNYYPFGLKHKGYNSNTTSHLALKWKYNSTEYEEALGLDLYEMDVRSYDPAIARFTSIDPVTHHSMSPYLAFDGNPVYWADPSGANSENLIANIWNTGIQGTWYSKGNGGFSTTDPNKDKDKKKKKKDKPKTMADAGSFYAKAYTITGGGMVAALDGRDPYNPTQADEDEAGDAFMSAVLFFSGEWAVVKVLQGGVWVYRTIQLGRAAKATMATSKFVKLLQPLDELDEAVTLYRGTTGSEAGSASIFLTDNAAVAATYIKNGGQVVSYRVSQYALKFLEQSGTLNLLKGIHGAAGKVSTEYQFIGKELVEALNKLATPLK